MNSVRHLHEQFLLSSKMENQLTVTVKLELRRCRLKLFEQVQEVQKFRSRWFLVLTDSEFELAVKR